jgi:hypothetical protein
MYQLAVVDEPIGKEAMNVIHGFADAFSEFCKAVMARREVNPFSRRGVNQE